MISPGSEERFGSPRRSPDSARSASGGARPRN